MASSVIEKSAMRKAPDKQQKISNGISKEDILEATKGNDAEVLRRFLQSDAKAGDRLDRLRGRDGRSLLHLAALEGSDKAMTVLLQCPKLVRKLNATDSSRRTPLHLAAATGDAACVQRLFNAQAALDPHDEWGCTPLHLAIKFEWIESVKTLMELAADPGQQDLKGDNAVDMAQAVQEEELHQLLMGFQPMVAKQHQFFSLRRLGCMAFGRRKAAPQTDTGDNQASPPTPSSPTKLSKAQELAGETTPSPVRQTPKGKGKGAGKDNGKDGGKGARLRQPDVSKKDGPEVHRMDDDDSEFPHEETDGGQNSPRLDGNDWYADWYDDAANANLEAPSQGQQAIPVAATELGEDNIMGSNPDSQVPGLEPEPSALASNEGGGLGGWLREKFMATGLSDVAVVSQPQPAEFEGQAGRFSESEEDETGAEDNGDGAGYDDKVFRFHFMFDASAEKLEFEVAWQTREDGERIEPSVGMVDPGGQAQRRGVLADDEIVACNSTATAGKVRQELIPLLRERPLLLKVDRRVRASTCAVKVEFGEEVKGLGIKLSETVSPPYIADVLGSSAAELKGLMKGDALVALNGQEPPDNGEELRKQLKERPLFITICRLPLSTIK
jgi:hypothetical protein